MKKFLVVGGSGVAGTAAISAVREHYGAGADVTTLWYGKRPEEKKIEGADRVLWGDITDDDTRGKIATASGTEFDYVFLATARGDVGFPIEKSRPEQIAEACRLSFNPLISLENQFSIGVLVAYSTFYLLEHQRLNYGAMGHAKERIEKWVLEPGDSRRVCIRSGAFESASSKAIMVFLQRQARELASSGHPLLEKYFRGRKPSEAVKLLRNGMYKEEKQILGDSGTGMESLVAAHLTLFRNPDAKFVNVCGARIWLSDRPQLLSLSSPSGFFC